MYCTYSVVYFLNHFKITCSHNYPLAPCGYCPIESIPTIDYSSNMFTTEVVKEGEGISQVSILHFRRIRKRWCGWQGRCP